MYTASYIKYTLKFIRPAGTSRGILRSKESYFVFLRDSENPAVTGIGECSLIPGLSRDKPDFEKKLKTHCFGISDGECGPEEDIPGYPAMQFGFETAMMDLNSGGEKLLFPSAFTLGKEGIPINGLIWMGSKDSMISQIREKIRQGFSILKLKVGAIDFNDELELISLIRKEYDKQDLEIRLDANGAWNFPEAAEKMDILSRFSIHSIEQPIRAGQAEDMAKLCLSATIPIALDEELIGIEKEDEKRSLLKEIRPAYIILKPSLLGGINASREWISHADQENTGWWVTSALESNIGLNAIAQWTSILNTNMPQGLGTGSLYENNIPSPLKVVKDRLYYLPGNKWNTETIKF